MIDGKSHGHGRSNIPGITHLLEVGSDGDGKVKKDMIQNV